MDEVVPAAFYTGIVVEVYGPLRSSRPDARPYADFIRRWGEPALELGCGDGDPMLTLRAAGFEVEGLDSSADMLAKLRRAADDRGIEVATHHSAIEHMQLDRTYRSIFLAGPTFNLIPDDPTAMLALERIRDHLEPAGAALIPLFIPDPLPADQLGLVREHVEDRGRVLRVTATASEREPEARRQTTILRYEVIDAHETRVTERPWVLHWYAQDRFRELVAAAGLRVDAVLGTDRSPPAVGATEFAFVVRRLDAISR
jgi:trans-aconitate methyltransferase